MLTLTLSDFKKNINRYLDHVMNDFETLVINHGKNDGVVIISLADYNAILATQHELSSKENERRLDAAIEKIKAGKKFERQLIED
jgi:antitoxin YefM